MTSLLVTLSVIIRAIDVRRNSCTTRSGSATPSNRPAACAALACATAASITSAALREEPYVPRLRLAVVCPLLPLTGAA